MSTMRGLGALLVGLVLMATGAAAHAGTIQSLSVDAPETLYVGDVVQVTVGGAGDCPNGVEVELAPGVTQVQSGPFPMSFTHAYGAPGLYAVRARPNPANPTSCGTADPASVVVEVMKPGDRVAQLCRIVDCDGYVASLEVEHGTATTQASEIPTAPRIDSVWAAHLPGAGFPAEPAVLTPGARVYLKGEGFGDEPGEILLRGPLGGKKTVALVDLEWDADGEKASGKIPTGTDAPLRVDVELELVNRWGQASNRFARTFETPGRIVHVDADSELVQLIQCGDGANANSCRTDLIDVWTTRGCLGHEPAEAYAKVKTQVSSRVGWDGGFTFKGSHGNCHTDVNQDYGSDKWLVDVRNSPTYHACVIYDVNVGTGKSRPGDTLVQTADPRTGEQPTPEGEKYFRPRIHWEVSPGDYVAYAYSVWLKCPEEGGS